ncbi:MAG: hypothetical protein KQI35_05370 [Bacteroidetes bacterium]|nr:hypothetical protein [Bacteroidota bacterium]
MKTKHYISYLLNIILAGLWLSGPLYAQDISLVLPERAPEKVTLLTDRNLYIAGENIWFSASCFLKDGKGSSPVSNILYVELYDVHQKIFVQEKFMLANGSTSGMISIPEELPSAHYFIRAYTQLLRNYPPESYFNGSIAILNPEFPPVQPDIITEPQLLTQFGALIPGIPNRIALQYPAYRSNDIISLTIMDTSGFERGNLNWFNNGLATGIFTPSDTNAYFIRMMMDHNDTLDLSLPDVRKDIAAMQTSWSDDELRVGFFGNLHLLKSSRPLNIEIWSQEYELIKSLSVEEGQTFEGLSVDKSQLTEGLIYVVVRSQDDRLIDMNTLFKAPDQMIDIPLKTEKLIYNTREKVELTMDSLVLNHLDIGLLQLSVVKEGTILSSEIISANLLANPVLLRDASINLSNSGISEQLQAGLMIYNDRAKSFFDEFKTSPEQNIEFIPDIRDVSITGVVKNKNTGQPLPDLRVYASVLHDNFQLHTTKTSGDGRFILSLPQLEGNQDLFLCTDADSLAAAEILLYNDFSTQFIHFQETPLYFDTSDRQLMESLLLNLQVSKGFGFNDRATLASVDQIPSWFGTKMKTIVLSDYIALISIQEVFNEIVTHTRLRERNGQYQLLVYDDQSELTYDDPLILLDGIPITDAGLLLNLHPAQIDRIEVMNRTYIMGDLTIRGLVSIRTKTDNFGGIDLSDEVVFINYRTRSLPAKFTPVSKHEIESLSKTIPWFKTLLFYDQINGNDNETLIHEFFTSDHPSRYQVILSGHTISGQKIRGSTSFQVSRQD